MVAVVILLATCYISSVVGRNIPTEAPTEMTEEGLRSGSIRMCGNRINSVLELVCKGKFNTPSGGNGGPVRGISDECCKQSCPVKTLAAYCLEEPSWSSLQRAGIIFRVQNTTIENKQRTTPRISSNQVRQTMQIKARRDRDRGKGKPVIIKCMYHDFARLLLKEKRRLQRKRRGQLIKADWPSAWYRTVGPIRGCKTCGTPPTEPAF